MREKKIVGGVRMDYKERFRNMLKRLKSSSNRERYNAICILTQNDDEQRVWAICREFWGNNKELQQG